MEFIPAGEIIGEAHQVRTVSIKQSPQLPFGYPTSMVIALIPPLWFKIMNKRIPREMISD